MKKHPVYLLENKIFFMDISIIGTGYVGLVTGTCFAEKGNNVVCIDIDVAKVQRMQQGIIPIYEPGLEELFTKNIAEGRLTFTTDLKEGIKKAEVIFLALPTPPGEDGSADLKYILNVAEALGPLLNKYTVIVNKSTVPVGTAEKVASKVSLFNKVKFDVVSNPEFLREGLAVKDFMEPERVVVGSSSPEALSIMKRLYRPFIKRKAKLICMDEKSAEMTKYAANSFLALKISYMNELANLCENAGADIDKIKEGIGTDSRIGSKFLNAGIGYGGSCFPKDVCALEKTSKEYQYDFKILRSVMEVNERQKFVLIPKIKSFFQNDLQGKVISVWGLSFKPDTDDIREAPALTIIDELLKENAIIRVYDPQAMDHVKKIYQNKLIYCPDMYYAAKDSEALIICTEWQEFSRVHPQSLKLIMKSPVIFDGRNIFDPEQFEDSEFYYESIGRRKVTSEKIIQSPAI